MPDSKRFREVKGESFNEVAPPRKNFRPHISFSLEDLPEAKDWKPGNAYDLNIRVVQKSLVNEEGSEGHAGFEVVGIKVPADQPSNKKVRRYT